MGKKDNREKEKMESTKKRVKVFRKGGEKAVVSRMV